jgi:hypothetical protein
MGETGSVALAQLAGTALRRQQSAVSGRARQMVLRLAGRRHDVRPDEGVNTISVEFSMLAINYRRLTSEERQKLEQNIASKDRNGFRIIGCLDAFVQYFIHLIGGFVLGGLITTIALMAIEKIGFPSKTHLTLFMTLLFIGSMIGFTSGAASLRGKYRYLQKTREDEIRRLKQDLADDKVEMITGEATSIIGLWGDEDTGLDYILDLGDSKLLYVAGVDLYLRYEETDTFPGRRIEITRIPHCKIMLDIQCSGEPLKYRELEEDFWIEGMENLPETGEIIEGDLHHLYEAFNRYYEESKQGLK